MDTSGLPAVVAVGPEGDAAHFEDQREVNGYSVDALRLANELAVGLGLKGPQAQLSSFPLFDVGIRMEGASTVRCILQLGSPDDPISAMAAVEARRTDGSRVALLTADGRQSLGGYPSVPWQYWRPPFDALWTRVLAALGIQDDNPWKDCDPAAKLLLHEGRSLVRYLGVDIRLDGMQQFHFLAILAKQKDGESETTLSIASRLKGSDGTRHMVSMLKGRTLSAFERSFREAGRPVPRQLKGLIRSVRKDGGGYELSERCQLIP